MKMSFLNIALAVALVHAPAAFASDPGGYLSLSGARTSSKDASAASELDAQNAVDGFTASSTVADMDNGWKLFAGFRFNRNFALEGSYTDLGQAGNNMVNIPSFASGNIARLYETKTWGLAAVGFLPLAHSFDLFGKAGFHYRDTKWPLTSNLSGLSGIASENDNGTDLMYGIGADFNFSTNFALRAEWELLKSIHGSNTTGESELEVWSAGVRYNF